MNFVVVVDADDFEPEAVDKTKAAPAGGDSWAGEDVEGGAKVWRAGLVQSTYFCYQSYYCAITNSPAMYM